MDTELALRAIGCHRFDIPRKLKPIPLNGRTGYFRKTLDAAETLASEYLSNQEVKSHLLSSAEVLVRSRRARAERQHHWVYQ